MMGKMRWKNEEKIEGGAKKDVVVINLRSFKYRGGGTHQQITAGNPDGRVLRNPKSATHRKVGPSAQQGW